MNIHELPERIQSAIQSALDQCPADVFAETVERDENGLVIGVSLPGSNDVIEHCHLTFDQENETFTVQKG